jgi:hypothetical protein
MPDTGAPWNIPFVAPTDNPRLFPAADEAQALAVAAGLSGVSVVRQVVQTVMADTFSTTSTSYTVITGLTASITPETNTNKVLILVNVPFTQNSVADANSVYLAVFRGASNIVAPTSPGSRVPTFVAERNPGNLGHTMYNASFFLLDSPASDTAQTYEVHIRTNGASGSPAALVNRSITDTDSAAFPRGVASITLIEVAA